jgi:hypothetical protein
MPICFVCAMQPLHALTFAQIPKKDTPFEMSLYACIVGYTTGRLYQKNIFFATSF